MFRKLLKFFTGRLFISLVLISLQIAILINIFGFAQNDALWIKFLSGLSIMMALLVVVRDLNPAYKIGWMLIFMTIPVYGGLFYILFGTRGLNARLRARMERLEELNLRGMAGGAYSNLLPMKALAAYSRTLARQAQYIAHGIKEITFIEDGTLRHPLKNLIKQKTDKE